MEILRRGELTLPVAGNLCDELKTCLEGDEPVVLDLENVTEVDFACLQVILSAQRSFAGRGRPFRIREGDCIRRAWAEAGLPARGGADGQDDHDSR